MASRSGLISLGASLCLVACVEPDAPPYAHDDVKPIAGVADLAIDDGGQVQLEPGSGLGVGVEYTEGGQWSVTVTCDTQVTVQRCYYDVLVSTADDAGITAFEAVDLESEDELSAPDEFAVSAELQTGDLAAALGDGSNGAGSSGDGADGFGFTTSPGATVRVSALLYDPQDDDRSLDWLDWSDDPRFINWVGNGALNRGAPTNPVDLTPNRP